MILVERPAQEGDTVLLDYSGFVGDEQFEGGTAERQELKLGSGMFIPGFEEQLIGATPGEKKDVIVVFPEEYHAKDLAGALICCGIMGHLALQVILNIAVVTNTIPNTGITLPFISYGGTSAVFLLGEMGLAMNVGKCDRIN